MAMTRRLGFLLMIGAAMIAVAAPALLLQPGAPAAPPLPAIASPPLAVPPQPTLAAVYARPLFGETVETAPADAPELTGIVGRIDRDAVALVRTAEGTRTLRVGESVEGWRLQSLSIDAAFFTRGGERVRVALPAGEPDQ